MTTAEPFSPGTPVLYRTVDENQALTSVLPVRVVEDTPDQVTLWLPIGTPSMKPVLHPDAPRSPRRWLPGTWSLEPATWTWAELLILIPLQQRHAIWVCWSAERDFLGWYVNLQGSLTRNRLGFDHWDQQLDIVVSPDRSWRYKDEDELAVVVELGRMSATQADEVRAEAERVVRQIESAQPPFTDDQAMWKPPPDWTTPSLPDDWADPSSRVD